MKLINEAGAACLVLATLTLAPTAEAGGIVSKQDAKINAAFDIVETTVSIAGDHAIFSTRVTGDAGAQKPVATGKFEGAEVYAYVWPTSLNSAAVGFEKDQGIVALAATFHPDFNDGANGAKNSDRWHAHWVVLGKDAACKGGLKVVDIPKDATPKVPATWPGVPLLIDSPDYKTALSGNFADVQVPLAVLGGSKDIAFDGVTAGLRIAANLHAPLLCVENVFKVASGDLSLPGRIAP